MSMTVARVALRREVALCAAAACSEAEFWDGLREAGLLVSTRPDPASSGHPAGYAVALSGLTSGRDGRQIWFGDGSSTSG